MLKMELNLVQSVNQSTSLLMNQPNFRFHALSVNFVGIKSCEYVITLVGKTIFFNGEIGTPGVFSPNGLNSIIYSKTTYLFV